MDDGVPDGALYEALRLGSGKALRLLVQRHDMAMRRVALLYVPSGEAADVLVGRAWTTALPGLDMFTWHTTFRAWLFGILVTTGRGVAVRPDPGAPVASSPDAAREHLPWATLPWSRDGEDAVSAAATGLSRMALREREILWFRHAEAWPDREVCDVLGLTQGEYRSLRTSAETGLLEAVARRLGAPPPSAADVEAAAAALMTALRPDAGRTPESDIVRALRRWRADRGLTVWHRAQARWRLRENATRRERGEVP